MILRGINRMLAGLGFELRRTGRSGWSPDHLRRFGFAPRTLVDVGVGPGTPSLYAAFPDAELVLIEPLADCEPALQRIVASHPGRYWLCALGAEPGERVLRVEPGNPLKSSLLARTALTATGDPLEERRVPVTTLDRLLDEHGFTPPFGLKIDTEGFELDVVRGATRFLQDALFVIAEVSVAPRFEGGYAFEEFVTAIRDQGFRTCDVLHVAHGASSPGARYADMLFAKGDGP